MRHDVQSVDNLDIKKKYDDEPKTAVAVVYATAMLENSIHDQVTRSQMDSKDHLQRNILDFKFSNISTWEMGSGTKSRLVWK